jgi:valyl-tRNA synthetase
MSEISKTYEPQSVEAKWYQFWLDNGCFVANADSSKPAYSIVIPPPNVTGMLTLGHVLNNTIQDILARLARMQGREVLWLPGTDHAGIATQTVVEKTLRKQGAIKHREDLGRDKFLEKVWEWKNKHGGIIIQQLKKLGCSCDWTRERFTMDPRYSECVQRVFVDLYRKGLIYRGKRIVNWDPAARTALSDEEVIMTEERGHLWHIKYPLLDEQGQLAGDQGLIVATTRPETMLGDEAVAVNPHDERYQELVGRHALLPLQNKSIPIIADELVDPKFGTGCVKVTPAHDLADYEIALRHNLPLTVVIAPDGSMTAKAGKGFVGLDRMEARRAVIKALEEQKLLLKVEDYVHSVGYSQRSHVPIEPYLSEQWFLRYPSIERSTQAVENGQIKFYPERWVKTYTHWMRNLKDWCISRQLWWGHRLPVWYNEAGKAVLANRLVIVDSTGRELSGQNIRELRASAWKWARDHGIVGQQFRNLHTGFDILICKSSIAHTFSNLGTANVKLVPALPELIRHGVKVATLYHEPLTADVEAVHVFYSALRMAGILYRVKFTANQLRNGRILYDHQSLRTIKREFDGGKSPEARLPEEKSCWPASNSRISLADLVEDVNSERAFTRVQVTCPGNGWVQDPDVLDTWFSSWLWPFATMGWPEKTETLRKFYPTTDLVTGPDIIFFWVARMIMAGYEFMGAKPFANVYFTGIIRDKQGRKMSKSLGNSPDPLDLIAKYGADALRFGIMRSAPLGQDLLFDEQHVELGRNFCNKLWNSCRFRQMQGTQVEGEIDPTQLTSDDKWILLKLDTAIRQLNTAFAEYNFSEVAQVLHRFFWSEFCDWHLEASKAVLGGARDTSAGGNDERQKANTLAVIDFVLAHMLRLFHPFLPFITEELWQGLAYHDDLPEAQGGKTIMFARWPQPLDDYFKAHYGLDEKVARFVEAKYDLVTQGRNLRRQANVQSNKRVKFIFKPANACTPYEAGVLKLLLNAEPFLVDPQFVAPKGTPTVHSDLGELYLPLEGSLDLEAERERLTKTMTKICAEIERIEQRLNNPAFALKAPPNVLEEHRQRLDDWQSKQRQTQAALDMLAG